MNIVNGRMAVGWNWLEEGIGVSRCRGVHTWHSIGGRRIDLHSLSVTSECSPSPLLGFCFLSIRCAKKQL